MVLLKDSAGDSPKSTVKVNHEKTTLKLFANAQSSYLLHYYDARNTPLTQKEGLLMDFDPVSLPLGEYLSARRRSLTLNSKFSMLGHIANALRFLHYYRVIHMDLTPNNILINDQGLPRVIDFGEAYYQSAI